MNKQWKVHTVKYSAAMKQAGRSLCIDLGWSQAHAVTWKEAKCRTVYIECCFGGKKVGEIQRNVLFAYFWKIKRNPARIAGSEWNDCPEEAGEGE